MKTITRSFGATVVTAVIINTSTEFKWRLESWDNGEHQITDWSHSYSSTIVLKTKSNRTFGYATDYWRGILPVEEPFEIILGIPALKPGKKTKSDLA